MKKHLLRFADKEERLYDAIKKLAQNNRRSTNGEIVRAIDFYLQNSPEAKPAVQEVVKKKTKSP
jgi:hypothetical protein